MTKATNIGGPFIPLDQGSIVFLPVALIMVVCTMVLSRPPDTIMKLSLSDLSLPINLALGSSVAVSDWHHQDSLIGYQYTQTVAPR